VILVDQAWCEAELGNLTEARQRIPKPWLSRKTGTRGATRCNCWPRPETAPAARKIAEDLVREYPTDTLLNKVFVPLAQATSDCSATSRHRLWRDWQGRYAL